MMKTVVGVRFKKAGKIYYFDSIGLPIHQYDHVVVETAQGIEYGEVALAPREIDDEGMKTAIKPVLRLATAEDEKDYADLRTKERDARKVFEKRSGNTIWTMKLINVEYTFDQEEGDLLLHRRRPGGFPEPGQGSGVHLPPAHRAAADRRPGRGQDLQHPGCVRAQYLLFPVAGGLLRRCPSRWPRNRACP